MQASDDEKSRNIVRELGLQAINGIDEVNFFRDDNIVLPFTRPDGKLVNTKS